MSRIGFTFSASLALAASAFVGCSSDAPSTAASSSYLVESEPSGAVGVGAARESAKDDETIVVAGRIGGPDGAFIDGLPVFTIVDKKVARCADGDYCCTPPEQILPNLATVKLVDGSGASASGDARELLGVEELCEVVVEGTADRDEAGNLAILAQKVYVKR